MSTHVERKSLRIARDDRRDAFCRGNLAGVDHDEQFHEVVVHLPTARLDDVHILATHGFSNLDTEGEGRGIARLLLL